MLEHLHHAIAAISAAIGGFLLLLAGLKGRQAAPAAPGQASEGAEPESSAPAPSAPQIAPDGLTARPAAELVGHEAIVLEAYKDSEGIWTWGIGITDASGHKVERYIDNPQPIPYCLQVFLWLIRAKYLPAVLEAFAGHDLSEAELAAALSFHYNTGAIAHATWVDHWKAGDIAGAKIDFMQWDKPSSIVPRRQQECNLFFDGKWYGSGLATVYPVLKPSYEPDFRHPSRVDILTPLKALIGR